jgi:putative nucleic acid modification protein with dual OB domain
VCVAGYTTDRRCVRPSLPYRNLTESWLWENGQLVVRPFALVELDLLSHHPNPPHTEDWVINEGYKKHLGIKTEVERRAALLETCDSNVEQIFGAELHFRSFGGARTACWVRAGEGKRSLGTVGPVAIHYVDYGLNQYEKWKFRLSFSDQAGYAYEMTATDLAFREMLASLHQESNLDAEHAASSLTGLLRGAEVHLRIGLARPFRGEDKCYLQITGIYSFPDYLDGRCFADFR